MIKRKHIGNQFIVNQYLTRKLQSNMGYETNFVKSLRIQFLRFDLNRKEKSTLIIIIAFDLSSLIYIYIQLWFSINGEFLRFNEGAKEFLLIHEIERFWFLSHSYNIFLISLEILSIKFISKDQRRVDVHISISLLLSISCTKIIIALLFMKFIGSKWEKLTRKISSKSLGLFFIINARIQNSII